VATKKDIETVTDAVEAAAETVVEEVKKAAKKAAPKAAEAAEAAGIQTERDILYADQNDAVAGIHVACVPLTELNVGQFGQLSHFIGKLFLFFSVQNQGNDLINTASLGSGSGSGHHTVGGFQGYPCF